MATHARNVLSFREWHLRRWPHLPWLPPDSTETTTDAYTAILSDYLEDLMDADSPAATPKSRLTSIRVAERMCGPTHLWPARKAIVTSFSESYFCDGRHKERQVRVYTVKEVQTMERAATELNEPIDRLALATELRKLYKRLRQDDAIWGRPDDWIFINDTGSSEPEPQVVQWRGSATKSKGTEMRANTTKENMPWMSVTRGISTPSRAWHSKVTSDMHKLGMRGTDGYLVPFPAACRAGRRPPGATEHMEWISHLRRALVKAGFTAEQTATVSGHTAKRTMLILLNSSGLLESQTDQNVAGYHKSQGATGTARRYTLQEMAKPMRAMEQMCKAIANNTFDPDKPTGLEWDSTEIAVEKAWNSRRTPSLPIASKQPIEADDSSDDEAPKGAAEENHCPNKDDDAASRNHSAKQRNGYIYTKLKAAKDKQAPKNHVAVDWDKILEHVQ